MLTSAEVDALTRALASLTYTNGDVTAGDNARRVKNNLQITVDTVPQARPLAENIVGAVQRIALFFFATLP